MNSSSITWNERCTHIAYDNYSLIAILKIFFYCIKRKLHWKREINCLHQQHAKWNYIFHFFEPAEQWITKWNGRRKKWETISLILSNIFNFSFALHHIVEAPTTKHESRIECKSNFLFLHLQTEKWCMTFMIKW